MTEAETWRHSHLRTDTDEMAQEIRERCSTCGATEPGPWLAHVRSVLAGLRNGAFAGFIDDDQAEVIVDRLYSYLREVDDD